MSDVEDDVVAGLLLWREHLQARPIALQAKREALAALRDSGVPGRQVEARVKELLRKAGWTAEQIAASGLSDGQIQNDLARAGRRLGGRRASDPALA